VRARAVGLDLFRTAVPSTATPTLQLPPIGLPEFVISRQPIPSFPFELIA